MRHGNFAVLVAALFFIRHLIFDLQGAGPGLDHLFGQEVSCLSIAEAGVNVGDDRHDMGLVVFNGVEEFFFAPGVPGGACCINIPEHEAKLARVSLLQEGVKFFDEAGN